MDTIDNANFNWNNFDFVKIDTGSACNNNNYADVNQHWNSLTISTKIFISQTYHCLFSSRFNKGLSTLSNRALDKTSHKQTVWIVNTSLQKFEFFTFHSQHTMFQVNTATKTVFNRHANITVIIKTLSQIRRILFLTYMAIRGTTCTYIKKRQQATINHVQAAVHSDGLLEKIRTTQK